MTMYRVRTLITGSTVPGGGLATHYFDVAGGTSSNAVAAVNAFWTAGLGTISSTMTFNIQGLVDEIDESTGALTGSTNVAPVTLVGGDGGEIMSLATMGLVKWRTTTIVNGRRVQGRTFVPGPCENRNTNGLPVAAYITALDAMASAMVVPATSDPVVWHRPGASGPGSMAHITNGLGWNNWAVLRSRRDA